MAENSVTNSSLNPAALPDGPDTSSVETMASTHAEGSVSSGISEAIDGTADGRSDEPTADAATDSVAPSQPERPAAESENVTRILYRDKEILLIGTAHVSQDSAALVQAVIEQERPDSVCIELDADRYKSLKNPETWEKTDVVQVIKTKKTGFLLASLALSSYQKRMAKQLNTKVGGEMIQGMESAEAIGAELVLADRSIQTTFLRIWRKLSLWDKGKLMINLFFSFDEDTELTEKDLQELLGADMLESALNDVRKEFPRIGEILISERDQHLAAKIKEAPGKKIVAVLGGAHIPGVVKEIPLTQHLEEISVVPEKGLAGKIISWAIPAIILGLIVFGFVQNWETGLAQLSSWILWNGILASLFTVIALGHPLSILTAFVVAPISSLNPMLACGWFAGLVQAAVKKPTVKDVMDVQKDIFSLKGFYRNRFLRTLLVVMLANIGSSLGTYIAGIDLIRNLF